MCYDFRLVERSKGHTEGDRVAGMSFAHCSIEYLVRFKDRSVRSVSSLTL